VKRERAEGCRTDNLCTFKKDYLNRKKMNKKLYEMPEIEIVELETAGFLAGSINDDNDPPALNGGDDNGEGGENFDPNLF
jgi:hypothetical protein